MYDFSSRIAERSQALALDFPAESFYLECVQKARKGSSVLIYARYLEIVEISLCFQISVRLFSKLEEKG